MTLRLSAALVLLFAADAAAAAGPQSLPDWASPSAASATPAAPLAEVAPPTPPGPPPPVPVEGGLVLLAIAGAGYATKKLRARRRA